VICDVGCKLKAEDPTAPGAFELIAPFSADSYSDLGRKLLNRQTAEVLFNGPARTVEDFDGGRQLELVDATGPIRLFLPTVTCSGTNADSSGVTPREMQPPFTISWIPATHATDSDSDYLYIRCRFYVAEISKTWTWRKEGGLLYNHGALIDFRINDLRDTKRGNQSLEQDQLDRLVNIRKAYCFVVAPWELQMKVAQPGPRDVRVLEGDAWTSYLGRGVNPKWIFRKSKALVYQFDSETGKMISLRSPFSVFMDMGREPGITAGEYMRITLLVAIIVGLLVRPIGIGHAIETAWDSIFQFVFGPHKTAGVIGLVVFVIGAIVVAVRGGRAIYGGSRKISRWVRRKFRGLWRSVGSTSD
jgi:hypothetical protein